LRSNTTVIYLPPLILLFFSAFATLCYGAAPWTEVWQGVLKRLMEGDNAWNPLLEERLPRLIVLLCTGASLAVSGAVLQSLFNNPLAAPSILGVSCGGSLAMTITLMIGWQIRYPYAIALSAFGGSFLTLVLVYSLARRSGKVHMRSVILTGIAVSTLLLAIKGAVIYALRDHWELMLRITEWEAGNTTDRNWGHVHMQLPLTIIGLLGCFSYATEINILSFGEEDAKNLGVAVDQVRWRLFLCVALLTAGAIAAVGMIAFFGLVLPHLLRMMAGPDNRRLIPLNSIAGAAVLLTLDAFLRFFDIHTFSIGNISAILGAIFFLLLLLAPKMFP